MTATTTDAASGDVRPDPHGSAQHGLAAHSHGGSAVVPNQSRAERRASFRVEDFPVPTGREEDWRFTPLDRLRDLHAGAAADGSPFELAVDAPAPVRVETVGRDDERLGRTGIPEDRVAAAAWCGFEKALVVTVPRGQVVETPVHIRLTGSGGVRHEHCLISAEAGSTGVVVVDLCGSGALADNLEIDVADGAVPHPGDHRGLGRRRGARRGRTTPAWAATPSSSTSSSPSAGTSSGSRRPPGSPLPALRSS